ncbi:MAG TPA: ABC transporter ATP-binding protein [Candidatus Limnocylindrales bacterium]
MNRAAGPAPDARAGAPIIALADVIRVYREADVETIALRGIDLEIAAGEFVAIMGRSGSGKSTLLGLIAGSDRPTAGRVVVDGVDLSRAEEDERARLRGARVGIVFQSGNLVPFLDLEENTLLAADLAGRPIDRAGAQRALARVGLDGRERHRPSQLSGGEQQRAALAGIVATAAPLVLADEVTGELDSANAELLLDLLADVHAAEGMTLVLATHDRDVARRADRVVELRDGRVVGDRRPR